MLNFGKMKHDEMGNFISFPNLIFAKFYLCSLAHKTLVSFLFSMEKGVFAKFLENPGGSLFGFVKDTNRNFPISLILPELESFVINTMDWIFESTFELGYMEHIMDIRKSFR